MGLISFPSAMYDVTQAGTTLQASLPIAIDHIAFECLRLGFFSSSRSLMVMSCLFSIVAQQPDFPREQRVVVQSVNVCGLLASPYGGQPDSILARLGTVRLASLCMRQEDGEK